VERFRNVLEYARSQMLTWVVDRAIFGKEVFDEALSFGKRMAKLGTRYINVYDLA